MLYHRSFLIFLLVRLAATLAFQMQVVAVAWQIYELTQRAFDLGMIGLVQFSPALLLLLIVGQVADRYDRRIIVASCQLIQATVAGLLCIGTAAGWLNETSIFILVFIIGSARAFEQPTTQALLPSLVTTEDLPRAMAWSSSAVQGAVIAGPAIGGFLYLAGPSAVYATSSILFLLAGFLMGFLSIKKSGVFTHKINLQTLFVGIVFIRHQPVILGALSLDLFAVLLGGATALLPIYAKDILHTGPWGLGLLRAAPAVGALCMAFYLARYPLKKRVGKMMFGAVAFFGLATIMFGLSSSLLLSMIALFVLGASDMISVVIRSTLVQLETPDAMRGRVSAVNSIFIGASNQLGEFESGLTAALIGVVPAVLLGGVGTLIVMVFWMKLFPTLLHRDQLQTTPER